MNRMRLIAAGLLGLAIVAGGRLWLEREEADVLRIQIGLLREQRAEEARLRAENARLKAAQISAEELARLRSDRAAVMSLRREVEQARERVDRTELTLTEKERRKLTMLLGVGADGGVLLDGDPFVATALQQRLAGIAPGSRIKVNLRMPSGGVGMEAAGKSLMETSREIQRAVRERGLQLEITLDSLAPK